VHATVLLRKCLRFFFDDDDDDEEEEEEEKGEEGGRGELFYLHFSTAIVSS
jgi:hypothetical protein